MAVGWKLEFFKTSKGATMASRDVEDSSPHRPMTLIGLFVNMVNIYLFVIREDPFNLLDPTM